MFGWCPGRVWVVSRCLGGVLLMFGWRAGFALFWWCMGSIFGGGLLMFLCCPAYIASRSRSQSVRVLSVRLHVHTPGVHSAPVLEKTYCT